MTALAARDRTGEGQVVDMAIIEPILTALGPQPLWYDQLGHVQPRTGNRSQNNAPRNTYRTADGSWVAVSTSAQSIAERVMRLVGRPELIDEPWFATGADRARHADVLDAAVGDWIAQRTRTEVLAAFEKAEAAVAPIQDVRDVMSDPQYQALDTITTVDDPELGPSACRTSSSVSPPPRRDPLDRSPARRRHGHGPVRTRPDRDRVDHPPPGGRPVTPHPLTWLYVPGDRPPIVAKALAAGADVVVVDLEDAVAPDRKDYARAATAELLSEPQLTVHVRVNALDTPWAADDLRTLAPLPGVSGLRLPKITSPEEVVAVAEKARDLPLYALLETALGIERAFSIAAAHSSVHGIALGEADLRADLGVRDDAGLDWSRSRVIVAARAAGLAPPSQSVHPDIRDQEGLAASCAHGRALGFLGRAAIHPRQLPVIERAFLPTNEEIEEAETIVKAAMREEGAQALPDGRFIDAAVVAAAQRTLALARRT